MNSEDAVKAYKAVVRWVDGHISPWPPEYLIPHETPSRWVAYAGEEVTESGCIYEVRDH